MGTMTKSGSDVVAFLKEQHKEVKGLLELVATTEGAARKKAFTELKRLLTVHEAAEEEIVHPVAKRELDNGAAIVKAREAEEKKAGNALAKLSKLDLDSDAFDLEFSGLKAAVLAHAQAEEKQEFNLLADALDQSKLASMKDDVEAVEARTDMRKTKPARKHV